MPSPPTSEQRWVEVQASTRRMFWSDPWGAVINDNLSVVQAELLEKAKKTIESSKKNAITTTTGGRGPKAMFWCFLQYSCFERCRPFLNVNMASVPGGKKVHLDDVLVETILLFRQTVGSA